jgi:hypothetical protein
MVGETVAEFMTEYLRGRWRGYPLIDLSGDCGSPDRQYAAE